MATERHVIKTYLNDEEKDRIDQLAHQMRLSRSELLKRLLMNTKLPSASDFAAWQGIRDLLKVNADQARLGNLFKLALDEPLSADLLKKFDGLVRDSFSLANADGRNHDRHQDRQEDRCAG